MSQPPAAETRASTGVEDLFFVRFLDVFHTPIKKSSFALFTIFLLCLCGIRAYVGFDGMNAYSHDLFVFLDGGWRVLNGRVPYNDFFTDAGTLIHLQTALGLLLAHGRAEGLAYVQALMGLGVGVWAYLLARDRLAPVFALLFVWTVVLLVIAPSIIGDPPTETTAAGVYNRYGYALVALIVLEAFYAGKQRPTGSEFFGGFSSGVAAALSLFIKISYFVGAGFLLLAMLPCGKQTRARWAGVAAGFVMGFTPVFLYMRGELMPMWSDLRFLAATKHISVLPFTVPAVTSATCQILVVVLLAIALFRVDGALAQGRRLAIVTAAVISAGIFFLVSNFQRGRLPLLPVVAFLTLQEVESRFRVRSSGNVLVRAVIALWCCLFVGGSIALDMTSLGHTLGFHIARGNAHGPLFDIPQLRGFQDVEIGYVAFVNDGIALLRKYRRSGETVASLDFSNPFSYGLNIPPPPQGTPVGLQYRTNFDDEHKLPPEFLFGQADLVMVPVTFTDGSLQDSIPRLYGPYLRHHFHLAGQSIAWTLYRNNRSPY